jgi:hypothetical protein
VIDDARYDVHDLTRWVDDPVRRYIDDYVIPMMTIASCFIPGTQGVTVPRAVAVAVPRVVPLLGRVATAYGAEEIYRRVTTFFNEQSGFSESDDKATTSSDRRDTSGYGEGKFWEKLQSVDSPEMQQKFGGIRKEKFGGGEMRTDGRYVYRFDPAHAKGKVHVEVYRKIKNSMYRAVKECDSITGNTISGTVEKFRTPKYKRIVRW